MSFFRSVGRTLRNTYTAAERTVGYASQGDLSNASQAFTSDPYLTALGAYVTAGAMTPAGSIASQGAMTTAAVGGAMASLGLTSGKAGTGDTPPDINEANDPLQAQQFQRIRKAARLLGRGGTIKNKSQSNLGLGDQVLGDQLSLIGS